MRRSLLPALIGSAVTLLAGCHGPERPALFTEMPPSGTGIEFRNTLPEVGPDSMSIIQYLYYYNGGGVAAGDVNNDGLIDLYFTANREPNRLYLNRGDWTFEDVTATAGVGGDGNWKTGVTMADVNADGWLDIYVCQVGRYKQLSGRNQLFVNNRDGSFSERAAEYGLDLQAFATQAAFFDYDLDGDLDCFVLCHSVHSSGSYRDTAQTRRFDPLAADRLYRNDNGYFTDVSAEAGIYGGTAGYGLGLVVGDINNDGYPDIYVGNDFHENDYLYLNQQGAGFRESITDRMGHTSNFTMGCDLADFNNDARPDLISLDMQPEDEVLLKSSQPADPYDIYQFKHRQGYHWQLPRNNLQLAQDDGSFSEIAWLAGVATTDWSWSALFADFNLDGKKDLFVSNGIRRRPNDMDYLKFISSAAVQRQASDRDLIEKMPSGAVPNYAFQNKGGLQFENVSAAWGLDKSGCSNGAVYADLDNDGDPDLVTNDLDQPASVFRNNSANANWLKIRFRGAGANTFGIGARLWVWTDDGQVQYYENQPVRGFQSAIAPEIVLGLGSVARADSLCVEWPGGARQHLQDIPARQILELSQQNAGAASAPLPEQPKPWFRPFRIADIRHSGASDRDAVVEKLAPWYYTTQGPRMAVGDFNGDSLDDLFLPGASPEPWMQKAGRLVPGPNLENAWGESATCAAFFDADGDGRNDLYVGTGHQPLGRAMHGQTDYILLSNNTGGFGTPVPLKINGNTSCIRPADIDGDGDADLFVGARVVEGFYGMSPQSLLLANDNGQFKNSGMLTNALSRAGMVTDARWVDFGQNGRPDLVVCGEWMPISIFRNTGKDFEKTEIPDSEGLWNCLAAADLDGDGDVDLVAGNFGLNSILSASLEAPLELWVADWDGNTTPDPVISYYRQGRRRVFADKDWLISQMPGLKKDFVQYRKFAGSDFMEVFPGARNKTPLRAVELASCWFENTGNGRFIKHRLPLEAQFSPVMALLTSDFNADGKTDILLGGNFFEVHPSIGRQDAGNGLMLEGNGKGRWQAATPGRSGFHIREPVRDLQLLRMPGGRRILLAGVNDGFLQAWECLPEQ